MIGKGMLSTVDLLIEVLNIFKVFCKYGFENDDDLLMTMLLFIAIREGFDWQGPLTEVEGSIQLTSTLKSQSVRPFLILIRE